MAGLGVFLGDLRMAVGAAIGSDEMRRRRRGPLCGRTGSSRLAAAAGDRDSQRQNERTETAGAERHEAAAFSGKFGIGLRTS